MNNLLKQATDKIRSDKLFSLRQYTNWSSPNEIFESRYGEMTYFKWAIFEKKRIEDRGGKVTIWSNPRNNHICLTLDHEILIVTGDNRHHGYIKLKEINWE